LRRNSYYNYKDLLYRNVISTLKNRKSEWRYIENQHRASSYSVDVNSMSQHL